MLHKSLGNHASHPMRRTRWERAQGWAREWAQEWAAPHLST